MDPDDLGAEAYHQPQNQGGEEWDKFYILFTPSLFLFPTTIILSFFLPQVCGWDNHLFRQCYMETSGIIKQQNKMISCIKINNKFHLGSY